MRVFHKQIHLRYLRLLFNSQKTSWKWKELSLHVCLCEVKGLLFFTLHHCMAVEYDWDLSNVDPPHTLRLSR